MCKQLMCLTFLAVVLGAAGAQAADFQWIRAAYWDGRYPAAWAGDGSGTRDALQAAGYEILDADQLKTWMDARIADKKYSVVVFCHDVVPDTVVESQSTSCTLRKYLDAGGKIVWYADIPFYYWGHATGAMDTWGDSGAPAVLGFNTSSAPRDSGSTATLTPAGVAWGLTQTWTSQRPLAPSVTTNVTVLARDDNGNAPAWAKHYVANDNFRGFVRFRDTGGQADVEDIVRVAEYVSLKASNPSPVDGATGVTSPLLMWSASSFGLFHDVYFGTTPDLTETDLVGSRLFVAVHYVTQVPFLAGTKYFWRVDEVEADNTVRTGDVWSFTTAPTTAYAPTPRNGDKWIDVDTDLTWAAGQGAMQHDVYLSTDEAAVTGREAGALKSSGQFGVTYDPGALAAETTYFWAVDEHALGDATYPGEVWRFTTGGGGGGVKGEYFGGMTPQGVPVLTRIDPEIDFDWGDPGSPDASVPVDQFSARWTADLEIAVADTYTFIGRSDDGIRIWLNEELIVDAWVDRSPADSFSQPIALEPGVYSLRVEYYENGGGAVAQVGWQTPTVARAVIPAGPLQPPVRAKAIYPQDNDANIPQDAILMWSAGEKAVQHHVYFGEDETAVTEATPASTGIYRGTQALEETTFDPGGLEWGKIYYWRIDEVNDAETDSPWRSSVFSFTTADFLVVDDFETYNDEEGMGTRIYETWLDGWVDPSLGGSTVGNWDPPFAEQTIVHTGKQSMPVDYNNVNSPFYSEACREWASPQDWTVNGVTDLTLWIRGNAATFVETAPGQYTISSNTADIWGTADNFRFVYKTLNGDGAISAKVLSVTNTSNWAKPGVMIRGNLDPASTYAFMFPTPDGRRAFQNRSATGVNAISAHSATGAVTLPLWVKVERKGNQFTAYYSTDGNTWTQQPDTENTGADASPNPQTIGMGSNVYIGLAVTSNNAAAGFCFAEFSDVVTTGSVSGDWKVANVGANPGNDPGPLYVTVQDSSNKTATATHPDPGAVNLTAWTEWKIPASDLAGVNLARVKRLYIGVGDKSPDGTGRIYIDDIRVTRPAP